MRISGVFILIFLFCLSCNRGTDILATYSDGSITRSEFEDWLESRNIPVQTVYKDKVVMSDYLRQIVIERLTVSKAEKTGFDKEFAYLTIEKTLHENLLSSFFSEKKRNEISFDEKSADLSIIRIFIKTKSNSEDQTAINNVKRVISNILSELNRGKDFNELASIYSEDAAAKRKGHLGIVPESIMDAGIKKAISTLKDNEYTKDPVVVGKSLCLLKVHKRYDITEKNIRNLVTDKGNAERILDFYSNKLLNQVFNELVKEKNTVSNINSITYNNKKEIIFSIEGDSFTTGELEEILKLFYSLKHGMQPFEKFSLKEKKVTSEKIFKERLFASTARDNHIDEDVKFKRNWFYLRRATLAGAFKYSILIKNSTVTEKDIRDEYLKNKSSKYYRVIKQEGKNKAVYFTFGQVKYLIRNQLCSEKLKSLKKTWDNDILIEGNYKIINKDFLVN